MRKATQQTINQLRDWGAATLSRAHVDIREADTLLAAELVTTTSYLLTHPEETVSKKNETSYKKNIRQRTKKTPLAYLVHTKGFFGLDFFVDERVLIPRPDTEVLIEWALKHIPRDKKITLADIGTGSGCIAITLAKYFPHARIIAVDTSAKALSVAKKNAAAHNVTSHITFKQGSLLKPIHTAHVDVVVSNPPYLEKHELGNVPYEPIEALHGGKNGLEIIDTLITQILAHKAVSKAIIEIHPLQEAWLDMRMRNCEGVTHYFIQDYGKHTRGLVIEKR